MKIYRHNLDFFLLRTHKNSTFFKNPFNYKLKVINIWPERVIRKEFNVLEIFVKLEFYKLNLPATLLA